MCIALLVALLFLGPATAWKPRIHDPGILEFTAPIYNLSLSEKWTVNATAWSDSPERVGVFIPQGYNTVKFKIVKGDKDQIFHPVAKKIGNFAFLSISVKSDQILNRELQDEFVLIVKATSRRKNDVTHEAQATINLRVLDDNDLFPFFKESEYAVTVDDQFPLNGQVVQLEGVDADVDLNGQIYYSLLTPSNFFYIEPLSGWVRSYNRLVVGTYALTCQVEDRSSRLFYYQGDPSLPSFHNQVTLTITVTAFENRPPKLSVQSIPLQFYTTEEQPAALLTISNDSSNQNVNVDLSSEVRARGDTFLRRHSANSFLLSVARVGNTAPGPVSLIIRDLSQPNGTFTAENIPLEMKSTERRIWFNGATDEDTPRIRLQVNESAPNDFLIFVFNINTTFVEDQNLVKYRIHGKESHKLPFHLDRATGQLRVKSGLSYSQKSLYELSVTAKLEGVEEKAFVDVLISVVDSNDNCPQFKNLPDEFQLKLKSTSAGVEVYKFQAEDLDTDANAQLSYKLIGINGSDTHFAIDPLSGSLKITKDLPTNEQNWLIKVMAIDAGWPLPNYATTLVQLVQNDAHATKLSSVASLFDSCSMKNEHAPKFVSNKTTFEVDEDAPIGYEIGAVYASDKDLSYCGKVQYTTVDSHFGVNLYTGRLFVQRPLYSFLDNHKKDHFVHELEVVARDQAPKDPKVAAIKLRVRINDVNNHAPEFEKFSYTIQVAENSVPSEELFRLKATDKDTGANGRIEYRMAVETDVIFVDPDSGAVRLEHVLNREEQAEHRFLLMAVDRGKPPKFAFANLTLLVGDVNDNAPTCGKIKHQAQLAEDSPNNQLVLCMAAHDADQGRNAQLEYEIVDRNVPFQVNRQTGCIFTSLVKPLNYEAQSSYIFNVSVFDLGAPPLSTVCPVEVKLVDVNENQLPPRFTEIAYEALIEENKPRHTEILTIKATDPDSLSVRYDLFDGDGLGYFELDSETGVLRSATVIDYERNREFWLTVRATDQDEGEPLSSYSHIYIRVIDVNDQRPLFLQPIYFPVVVENSEPNKVILRLNATDGDASTATSIFPIKYSIERGNDRLNFVLDENTGYLVTGRRHLDRETQVEHELYIQACDQGHLCSTVLVVVTVLDQNDNKPQFKDNLFNLTVPASQAGFLTRVFANDADQDGPNSDLSYSLEGNSSSQVTIDKFGRLFATEPLVAGTIVQLTIVAEDNGTPRLRSTASVRLTAIAPASKSAKTNRPPSFQNVAHWHHLYLSDNDLVGTMLGRIEATDPDNDPLWFRIVDESTNPNETFAFQAASSGELVLARRAELIGSHLRKIELTIAVTDGFVEIRDKVYIHVTRSSIARPRFDQIETTMEINGELPVGYVLYTAKAYFDQTNTGISHPHQLSYSIHYVTDVLAAESLQMDASDGNLILEKPLIEAVAVNFSVIISAKIGGGQENFVVVHFHKTEHNKHAPKFLFDSYKFTFEPTSNQIGSVYAFDIDSALNGQVSYLILSGNEDNYFDLNTTTGQLSLRNFSSSMFFEFTLTVRATDSSELTPLSSTCTVYLRRLVDNSDAAPSFENTTSLIVLDDQAVSQQTISVLEAVSESFVSYSTDCHLLSVQFGSGVVRLEHELGNNALSRSFNCTFFAQNTLTNHKTKLLVNIKTIQKNNLMIRFKHNRHNAVVKELAVRGSPLFTDSTFAKPMTLKADVWNGQHQAIRYRLLSPQESFFSIDSASGILQVVEPVDFETCKSWELNVIAHSTNSSNLKASQPVQVRIQVVNTNNHPPKFDSSPFELELILPTAKGTFVGQIRASDIDTSSDLLRYSLRSSSRHQALFRIDPATGRIFVATNEIKRSEEREYKLDVQVTDGVHSVQEKVIIKTVLMEKLLGRPDTLKLPKQQYIVHTVENRTKIADTQRPILTLDWPLNALVGETFDFRLATDLDEKLVLNPSNGLLYLNPSNPLDRELASKFEVVVVIVSRHDSQRFAQTIVQFHVDDINDSAPQFDQSEYEATLPEDAKVADKLLQIKATDPDLGINGIVRYSLNNDVPSFVEINPSDGRLLLKAQPTADQLSIGREYKFHVIASDQGTPSLSSKTPIRMRVVNRNQPVFTQSEYKVSVSESASLESLVAQVQAKSPTDGELIYQIIDGNPLRQFTIGFQDGRLLLNAALDRERQNKHCVSVRAVDLSRRNISATAVVCIDVEDVNDSSPEFDRDIYEYTLSENEPVGTLLGQVNATDPDLVSKDNQIVYQLINGNKSVLSVDPSTGQLYLTSALDFEREPFLEWTVTARDAEGLIGQSIIQLRVIDENDNPPKFINRSPVRLSIQATDDLSEPRFLYQFKATDVDTVDPPLKYSIDDGDMTLFELDSQNGILTQIRLFNNVELAKFFGENSLQKSLRILVSDGLFVDHLEVGITFQATANQLAPLQFNSLISSVLLNENRLITNRTVIDTLKVHGGQKPYLFSMPPTNGSWPFFVHPTMGHVYLASQLDRERTNQFVVPFTVMDANQQLAFMRMEVKVQQDNDNSPKFVTLDDTNGYQVYVSITATENDQVAKVMAKDIDEDDVLEYILIDYNEESRLNPLKYFALDSHSGYLTVQAPIPANLVGQKMEFAVKVIDQNNPPHQHRVPFKIHVTDAPVPQFSRLHFYFAVSEQSESGTVVGQLTTTEHSPKDLTFDITKDDELAPFALDKSTGRLTLRGKLDREAKDQHHFVVSVENSQGLLSFCFVTVNVIDANDNKPQFVTQIDRVFVREDVRPGSVVNVFHAIDLDQGANSRVQYELKDGNSKTSMFRMDSDYGWLFVGLKRLDREKRSAYNLTVVARDGGGLYTEWPFQLIVRDVNDNAPVFEKSEYMLKLNRNNCQVGQKLLRLNVNDADTSEVQSLSVMIVSNEHNGMLKLVGNDIVLNALPITGSSFNTTFKLIAFDGMHSTLSSLKLQWNAPKDSVCVNKNQTIPIASNRPVNSSVLLLNSDNRQILIHHLLNAEKLPFEIVNNSELIIKDGYYKLPQYDLRVRSIRNWNNIEQSCVQRYKVQIEAANRMAVHFDLRNFTVHVPENSNASADKFRSVMHLPAVDDDFGRFGQLTYELQNEKSTKNADQYFEVHESAGVVLLKRPLDRESHEKFELQVKVTDGGDLSDYANITVIVDDENDNAPTFSQPVYHLKVLENEAVGYVLLKLVAHDSDFTDQKLSYELKDQKAREFVELDAESGVLRLIQSLDYEKIQSLNFEVIVRDNGQSPLESKATVELEVLDLNDNAPRFEQTLYEASVNENSPIGTKIIKVLAHDLDSEHFGKVSYALNGEDADLLVVTDEGWIELAKPLDYEKKKLLRVSVKTIDGGMPALSDETLLSITVLDINEHPPKFSSCEMSAVIQEGVQAGQSLLTVQLTDEDSPGNGPPFRLEIRGDGASAFTFDPMLNLITTRQLSYSEQQEFHLNVTAFDVHGLNYTCPLSISVKKQSRHAPETRPVLITLNALYGEFLGGNVGRIRATDKDTGDLLRFSIIEAINHAPTSLSFDHSKLQSTSLYVDASTGELNAAADLLPGFHRFNISVTDGRFVALAPVTLDVAAIDQEALDSSISLQLNGLTAEKFVQEHMTKFIGILSRLLSVPLTYVRILSVQDVDKSARSKRQSLTTPTVIAFTPQISNSELELLLTVSRGESRGFHRPSFVKQRISEGIAQLTAESGLEVTSLTSEVCRSDTCSKGECRDRLWLDNVNLLHINDEKNGNFYLFPRFLRTYECICKEGFGGSQCDVAINKCSREMCIKYEMCIPNDNEPTGFACSCPPGLKGDRCAVPSCDKPSECAQKESISLLGNGYFQLFVAQSLESRMELLVEFKTVSRNAYLMYASGSKDFHSIVVENGHVAYQWDCGTGMGQVKISNIRVDDGQWHNLKIVRRGRQVKLILDNYQAEGASPPGSDVVNLHAQAMILTFGAQLLTSNDQIFNHSTRMHHRQHHHGQRQSASDLTSRVENGTIGCIGRVGIDGFDLSKTQQGLRLFNARIGCDTQVMGACLSAPCLNNGQCLPKEKLNSYSCLCSERYTGANCEIDLNACLSQPCPVGISCFNLYNDFHCACPSGFTGKTCQMRGDWDPCLTNPCGPFGTCVRYKSSFICNCTSGFGGSFCSERVPKMTGDNWSLQSPELYVLFGILLTAFLCALIVIVICRRKNRSAVGGKSHESLRADSNSERLLSSDDPTNALIPTTLRVPPPIYQNTVERTAPPLPPKNLARTVRNSNQTLLSSGLPTVEVRPMQSGQRLNSRIDHVCCSTPPQSFKGSLSSAVRCSNPYDETYEESPKPAPPPHRFLLENEENKALLVRQVVVKNSTKKEKNISNPATSMSSLDNASSSGDYLTMKPISKKKNKTSKQQSKSPTRPPALTGSEEVENGIEHKNDNAGDKQS